MFVKERGTKCPAAAHIMLFRTRATDVAVLEIPTRGLATASMMSSRVTARMDKALMSATRRLIAGRVAVMTLAARPRVLQVVQQRLISMTSGRVTGVQMITASQPKSMIAPPQTSARVVIPARTKTA